MTSHEKPRPHTPQPEELSSRERILHAAMVMFGEDPGTRLSVRTVAARAGVSTGSLRHHFPTQRALQDAVLTGIYDVAVPDDPIHDQSLSPADRLVACLRQVLAPATLGAAARKAHATIFRSFIEPEPTPEIRSAYLAIADEAQRRVEYWLTVLGDEGVLPEGNNARRARFLNTVLSGLALDRALPAADSLLTSETETLYDAVAAVLGSRPNQDENSA
ncbi:TetR/AcrR family transcriptional regulator [Propionibacteriaceae bacterium Y1685]|uniref:TetR/AcrR family transcriptional regulator n=1 Tax=Microlunatus sp. Y1700 TaxID=3418487 RepID=UPI003B81E0F2